jgi:hypothetical protein
MVRPINLGLQSLLKVIVVVQGGILICEDIPSSQNILRPDNENS